MVIPTLPYQRIFDQSTPSIIFAAVVPSSIDQEILDKLQDILDCCNSNNSILNQLLARSGGGGGSSTVTTVTGGGANIAQINSLFQDMKWFLSKYRKEVIRNNREIRDGKRTDHISQSITNR